MTTQTNPERSPMPRGRGKIAALLVAALALGAGAGGAAVHLTRTPGDATADEKQTYQCPMHPTIVQDHPGDCPICGMKLVKMEQPGGAAAEAALGAMGTSEAKQTYQCPMHPTIVQDHPGDCPICGMKLVKMDVGGGASAERKLLYYRSPMDPKQTSPTPRKDEMGMDYVPVYSDEVDGGAPPVEGLATVKIDPGRQQLIGLKTAAAERGTVGGTWRTVGRVAMDETRVRHINVKVASFVEKIHVDFVGRAVRRGEPLFSIYSPELYSAQEEYLLALKTQRELAGSAALSGSGESLLGAARKKLRLWDIPERQIEALEKTGETSKTMTLYSPISGVVTKKDVVEGMRLEAGAMPYEIVDLSQVWVLADVYESELRHVKTGMSATLTLKAYPNRTFKGRVVFLDPLLDPKTRTAKVRVTFPNPTGELKPEMFGEVVLEGSAREGLRVPSDAVIDSGTKDVVFVSTGDGKFQPREVKLGDADGTHVEVVSGLSDGEQVVTRANFLVDSESRLKASLAALTSDGAKKGESVAPAADPHAGHAR